MCGERGVIGSVQYTNSLSGCVTPLFKVEITFLGVSVSVLHITY